MKTMLSHLLKKKYQHILKKADIELDGERPWDIRVHNPTLYRRVWTKGNLGLGEAYMDGWWECDRIDQMVMRIFKADIYKKTRALPHLFALFVSGLSNLQKIQRAFHIGEQHYDLSNELFECMLDRRMIYSCGYWKNANNLDEAQQAKLKLVFDKLYLERGMTVLDIGCGWGGAARFAAEHYGVSVTGITVSKQQAEFARNNCAGLPIKIDLQDYRNLNGQYDRIYSIGMFEHVGYKNHRIYFETVRRLLKKDGLSLLHTIGSNTTQYVTDPWISKYIFPNSLIPSAKQLSQALEGLFVIEDWQNFGPDYAQTLLAWFDNFNHNWESLKSKYDERFYRMWKYYLLTCAGSFLGRSSQTWQLVLSAEGTNQCYHAPR